MEQKAWSSGSGREEKITKQRKEGRETEKIKRRLKPKPK